MTRTHTKNLLLVLNVALFMATTAFGQKQTPPAGGPPKAFTLAAHETYTLANGMKVTLVPYGNIPKVSVSLALRAGNLNEPKELQGVADVTGELLKEGTTSLSASALAESTARMGSTLNVGTGADETSFDMDVLSEFGPDAVKLLADVLQHPLLPESELARLKANQLRQIAVAKSQPGQIALARFRKLMYGDHPYGTILPTEENVNKMTIADAKKFYADNYGAVRSHLYVAGKFDVAAVKKAIEAGFSGWAKGPAPVENVPKPKTQRLLDVTDRPGAPQATVYVGLPAPNATSPDNIPLGVTNALLGGSFGSRITSNIREKLGCTYSPSSQV
jgi:zinc protease